MQAGLVDHHALGGKRIPPSALVGYKHVLPGEIVMNRMRAAIGLFASAKSEGLVSPDYAIFRPFSSIGVDYAVELFRTSVMASVFRLESRGLGTGESGFLRLYTDRFGILPIPLPPPDEQAAIVRFLDHANRRIERYTRGKRKLIALLNEQKQAIIHRAVTRGLDPNVPMKDSGVSWLGEIAAHWDTPMLGRCVTRIEQGWSPVAAEGEIGADQWTVVTLSSVRRGDFNASAVKPISRSAEVPRELTLRDGDFLLTRSNTRERVGDVCIVKGVRPKTILCDLIYRLSLRANIVLPFFLAYQLMSPFGRWQVERSARGSSGTMPKIAQSHIGAWRVFLPPLDEQRVIAEQIAAMTAPLEASVLLAEREIALMREYHTRLVSDVVTGQLDVREAARDLSELEPESTTLDTSEADEDSAPEDDIEGDEAA
jgi:type I restriction enzyme S subunit